MINRQKKMQILTNDLAKSFLAIFLLLFSCSCKNAEKQKQMMGKSPEVTERPNILFAISDDQTYPYGDKFINTPAFDRIAEEGVLFSNAFAASPGCSPSRAAILTGRNCWQIEEAGTHSSGFPTRYVVYPDLLEQAGYFVGYTGKGWSPGDWKITGRTRNPAGTLYQKHLLNPPSMGISRIDYARNFADFLAQRSKDQPFCFWYGGKEPHRGFEKGSGQKAGKRLDDVQVPAFLPDNQEVRGDILDYALEIEWFDQQLGQMIQMLEEAGELENTIIVVTSDNGMAFPRAKANLYEYGFHVPLAIRWGDKIKGNRIVEDIVSLIDLAPTFMDAAGIKHPAAMKGTYPMAGKSLMNILFSRKEGQVDPSRKAAYAARERHSSSRWNNLTYPQRCLRTSQYLYIRNFKPERWPSGAPQKYEKDGTLGPMHDGYEDVDGSPTLDLLLTRRNKPEIEKYFHLLVDKRPEEELFDIKKDPACLNNLANDPAFNNILKQHRYQLGGYLMQTGDPRVTGNGDVYESYKRYILPVRKFPVPEWVGEDQMEWKVGKME